MLNCISSISRWGSLGASNNYKYAESFSALVNYSSDYSNRVNTTYIIDITKDKGRWKVQCHLPYDNSLSNHEIFWDRNSSCSAFQLSK